MSKLVWGLLVLVVSISGSALAESKTKSENGSVKKEGSQNKKEVSFEDLLVQGKYQFADEAVTTVEDDKVLDSLLGVRKDFKDRLKRSAARY